MTDRHEILKSLPDVLSTSRGGSYPKSPHGPAWGATEKASSDSVEKYPGGYLWEAKATLTKEARSFLCKHPLGGIRSPRGLHFYPEVERVIPGFFEDSVARRIERGEDPDKVRAMYTCTYAWTLVKEATVDRPDAVVDAVFHRDWRLTRKWLGWVVLDAWGVKLKDDRWEVVDNDIDGGGQHVWTLASTSFKGKKWDRKRGDYRPWAHWTLLLVTKFPAVVRYRRKDHKTVGRVYWSPTEIDEVIIE